MHAGPSRGAELVIEGVTDQRVRETEAPHPFGQLDHDCGLERGVQRVKNRVLIGLDQPPDEALRWFKQALDLLGPDRDESQRCELLVGIGVAQKHLGDPAFRSTLLEAAETARRIGNVGLSVRATIENTRGWHSAAGVVDAERVAGLEASIATVDAQSPDRPVLLALLAAELTFSGDSDRVRRLTGEALSSARALEDRRPLARVLYFACNAQLGSADTASVQYELSGELEALAEALADPQLMWGGVQWRFTAALQLGDMAELDRSLAKGEAISIELGQPALRWALTYYASVRHMFAGELEAAEAATLRAAGLGHESGQADALMIIGVQLFAIRHEQGRLDELIGLLEQRVAENPGLPTLQATLAFAYTELGRNEEAEAILDRAAADDFASLPFDVGWISGMARYAEVAARLGARPAAAAIYGQLLPYRERIVTSIFTVGGSMERVLGLLAATLERSDQAEAHFAAAAAVHERTGARLFLARTWMNWGRALLARDQAGDSDRALGLLTDAHQLAVQLGGGAVEREAEGLLAARGARLS